MLMFLAVTYGAMICAIIALGILLKKPENIPRETQMLGLVFSGGIIGICIGVLYLVCSVS